MKHARGVSSRRWLILGVGTLLATWAVGARAVDPETPAKKDDARSSMRDEIGARLAEKKVAFEMRDKPWSSVLEWLADQTGLPVSTDQKPTGTFTFIAPRSGPQKYTIPQVIDILNEALVTQNYLLIRRDQSFTIVPADKKIDPAILPRILPSELDNRGNSELVSVVVPLTSLVAEDAATEIKKMMGPFGEVVALARANQLVLQDTVGNLKRIRKTLRDIEDNDKNTSDSYSHTCKYIKAREAERILKDLLGDPRDAIRAAQPAPQFPFGGGFGGPGGGGFGRGGGFGFGGGQQPQQQQPAQAAASVPKVRMYYITADEGTNSVLVTGPADKIATAREIMKKIDVAQKDQPPVLIGPPVFKQYPVPGGNAEAIAKTLQDIYKSSSRIRISAVGNSTILAYAGPEEQFEIAKQIAGTKEQTGAPQVIALSTLEASKVVDTLKGMFGSDPKAGSPYLEADTARNAVIVKGTTEQVSEVKTALQALGEGGGVAAASGNTRIITLDKGGATALAEALQRMLSQMRQNPVNVVTPGGEAPRTEPSSPRNRQSTGGGEEQDEPPQNRPQLSDPQKPANQPQAGSKSPVNITVVGNRLIITSDDPQALALTQELARLLTQTPGGEGDFEIIRLKNANAVDAAKVLDEAFNGKQQPAQPQGFGFGGGGFFNRFAAQGATAPTTPSPNSIRVVADAASNSLLIKASPLDMLRIRRLLDKAIDAGETDSKAVIKTWLLPPLKNASATEVANVIRDVYRESINNNPVNMNVGGFPGFGFGRGGGFRGNQQNVDANGNPRGVTLSVGVDERSNSLVLACSEAMYQDIKKLVAQLEDAAKNSTKTVQVVPIKGIDPTLVQEAIDAIQGRRSSFRSGNGTGPTNGFGGGFGGFNGGGFRPGVGGGGFGGNGQGGGFRPGFGGGGGGGPPGGQRGFTGNRQQSRGPDFFDDRVTDDPQPSVLFDPQLGSQDGNAGQVRPAVGRSDNSPDMNSDGAVQPVAFQQAQPPAAGDTVRGPRSPVTAEALEQLGVIVISGDNPADVEQVINIIKYIQALGAGAEVQIRLVPLENGDATSVANTLNQLYQRVIVGAGGNVRSNAPTTTTSQTPFGQQTTSNQQAASVVLLPLPRFNAILLAAPKARIEDVIGEIKRLDRPTSQETRPVPFPLKKASASRVATLVTNFYAQRYPTETAAQNQIRITYDDSTNTVFVQAAKADLAEIKDLIDRIDNTVSSAVNELRIVPLKNAVADELTTLLVQSISQGIVAPSPTTPGIVPTAGGLGAGGAGLGALGGGFGALGGGLGGAGALGGGAAGLGARASTAGAGGLGAVGVPSPAQTTGTTKTISLRFISSKKPSPVEAGILEDIHITPDLRINSLILAAPAKTMELLLALIRELDVPPPARAEIKVFSLRKADAGAMAATLQQLFFGTGNIPSTGVTGGALGAGGLAPGGGLGGVGGALGGAPLGGATAGGVIVGIPRVQFTVSGTTPEGAPIVELHITVDPRTNSLIVAGGRNDLDVIEAIISRLEDSDVEARRNEVIHLRNASAADVASALQGFLTNSLAVLQRAGQLTVFQEIERDVVVVPEPFTNKLLISATPRYFGEIIRLIEELDAQPAQVVIQVLIASVDLTSTEEFGVEVGLQSPVLFSRSVIPADGLLGTGSINYASATGGLVPPGVTVNNSINPTAQPGFNFNNVGQPLGNNPAVGPGIVGFQGLNNLGVGRASATGIGGFVFSAASNSFNLLIRALKTQGRVDVLSRPQIQTMDNQTAYINIGQSVPYVTGSSVASTGQVTNLINYRDVGVLLQVTPRISPDGTVYLRVVPEVSSVSPTQINLGNGQLATQFNVEHVETTVTARDGETVAIGGLITKRDEKQENKIPLLGDMPWVGALFRYRTQHKLKSELLVILTPHVVRSAMDADRILAEEAKRMDWIVGDVIKTHGTSGMGPILPPPPGENACPVINGQSPTLGIVPGVPTPSSLLPGPDGMQLEAPRETLPAPRTLPYKNPPTPGGNVPPPGNSLPINSTPGNSPNNSQIGQSVQAGDGWKPASPEPPKEKRGWTLFRRNQ